MMQTYLIVGIGGTTRPESSTERALARTLSLAATRGAETRLFDGPFLAGLPIYNPHEKTRQRSERDFVEAVRQADAILIASPGYHGGVAGFIKNALDLLEDTAKDERVYFDRMPIGLISVSHGWQAAGSTLAGLRAIVHAMRGWPTPLGVMINSRDAKFGHDGRPSDPAIDAQLSMLVDQMLWFSNRR